MSTKHYCDRCGREVKAVKLFGVFDWTHGPDGLKPQLSEVVMLCPECQEWIKANWPFPTEFNGEGIA